MLSPGASDCCGCDSKVNEVRVGRDALKRQVPDQFVPIFLTVNVIAGRSPSGTLEAATNESAEVVVR